MRILVSEDNPETLALLLQLLKGRYRVDAATTGREAVALFRMAEQQGDPYGLLLFDVAMPLSLGTTALKEIREGGGTTPAIFLTALQPHEVRKLTEGLDGFKVMAKPFSPAELRAEIERSAG